MPSLEIKSKVYGTCVVLFDEQDACEVLQYKWGLSKTKSGVFYARTSVGGEGKRRTLYLHRLVCQAVPDPTVHIDHVNHNGLDNRRKNLRPSSRSQNQANQRIRIGYSSFLRGVSYHKHNRRYEARITFEGKQFNLGTYRHEHEAGVIFDRVALGAWNDFAQLNYPREDYSEDDIIKLEDISKHRQTKSSTYRGVSFNKKGQKYESYLWDGANQSRLHLGFFDNEEEAARAYDTEAKIIFGDRAKLNFPERTE